MSNSAATAVRELGHIPNGPEPTYTPELLFWYFQEEPRAWNSRIDVADWFGLEQCTPAIRACLDVLVATGQLRVTMFRTHSNRNAYHYAAAEKLDAHHLTICPSCGCYALYRGNLCETCGQKLLPF